MVGPFPGVPYSFGALRQTYGPLFVRCDVCRRYARLYLAEIRDTDYRTKTFSCCRCGTDGALAITEPNTETGMTDYQLDQVEGRSITLARSRGSLGRPSLHIVCLLSTTG
jgi:hypothetical protein